MSGTKRARTAVVASGTPKIQADGSLDWGLPRSADQVDMASQGLSTEMREGIASHLEHVQQHELEHRRLMLNCEKLLNAYQGALNALASEEAGHATRASFGRDAATRNWLGPAVKLAPRDEGMPPPSGAQLVAKQRQQQQLPQQHQHQHQHHQQQQQHQEQQPQRQQNGDVNGEDNDRSSPRPPVVRRNLPEPAVQPSTGRPRFSLPRRRSKAHNSALPQDGIAIMKKWLYNHVDNPYPSQADKEVMAAQSTLTIKQINNWFINARRRYLQSNRNSGSSAHASRSASGATVVTSGGGLNRDGKRYREIDGDYHDDDDEDDDDDDDDDDAVNELHLSGSSDS